MSNTSLAETARPDLTAIRERVARREAAGRGSGGRIYLAAVLADDVPTLLEEIGRLQDEAHDRQSVISGLRAQRDVVTGALAELLRVHDTTDGWPEHTAAFERAREVLATVTPTTGGAA